MDRPIYTNKRKPAKSKRVIPKPKRDTIEYL